MEITRSRPVGISIIAILLGIQAVLETAYGLYVLVAAPSFVASYGDTSVVVHISPWAFLISGVFALILAYGLWTLRGWAFWAAVIIEVINLIGGTIALFTFYYPGAVFLGMVIPSVILIYFFANEHVLSAFDVG